MDSTFVSQIRPIVALLIYGFKVKIAREINFIVHEREIPPDFDTKGSTW
jgi:hypothetical protein